MVWEGSTPIAVPQPTPSILALSTSTGHRGGFASRDAPPVPSRDDPLDYDPPVLCSCKLKCLKLISWREGYEGRRYYRCSNLMSCRDCAYFEWIDPPYNTFLSILLLDLNNAVKLLMKNITEEKQKSYNLQNMYQARLRVKQEQLLEKEKQIDVKDAALQALAARQTFGTQMGTIACVFAIGVLCGVWWKTDQ